ncbi:MAG: sulfatase [Bryobacterales bacterium]|nr:sulfatase [Bryobacterales bacterium]
MPPPLTRREFGFLALAQAVRRKPNILFILIDDFGWNGLSCYGNKDVATPHIDKLAAQGMRFTAAYAEPQCSPTRAALLSGQYGARTGVFKVIHEKEPPNTYLTIPEANLAMQPSMATLATDLRAAGYTTGIVGKWHIADQYAAADVRERDGGRYFDRYGFDFASPVSEKMHAANKAVTALTDETLGFIERARNRPWFAYLAHFTTHTRLAAPQALVDKYAEKGYKRTSSPTARFSERPTAEYLAMVEHLDTETGRLLAKVDANTVVIFTADNGGLSRMASMAPLREGKGAPYEGGTRVPLIIRWPGKTKAGSTCDTPVHTIDHYPTLLAAAGARARKKLDGISMTPLLEGKPVRREALCWYTPTYTLMYGRTPCSWMRAGDWKLIHWYGDYLAPEGYTPDHTPYGKLETGPRWELYNLKDDPGEMRDLSRERPEKLAELRRRLEAWWKETGAKAPALNPDFDRGKWPEPKKARG